jgi:NADH-quinone oxidoreductase subunit N
MYVGDLMGDLLKLLLYLTVIVVLFYSRGYILEREQMAGASITPWCCSPPSA